MKALENQKVIELLQGKVATVEYELTRTKRVRTSKMVELKADIIAIAQNVDDMNLEGLDEKYQSQVFRITENVVVENFKRYKNLKTALITNIDFLKRFTSISD